MNSISDSSENSAGKASLRTSDASASNDTIVPSKFEAQKVTDSLDDCFSLHSETHETTKVLAHTNMEAHRSNLPCSSVADNSPAVQGDKYVIGYQTISLHENKNAVDHDNLNCTRHSNVNGEIEKVPPSSLPIEFSSQNQGLLQITDSKNSDIATDTSISRDTSNMRSLSCHSSSRDMEEDNHSPALGKSLKDPREHLNSLLPGTVKTDGCLDFPSTSLKCAEKHDDMEVEHHPLDTTDDSDIVEQDVKVCDICGDAGREDLLAICSRCSDGAEHTYCMREMLAKVPEVDWLCEECQSDEKVENCNRFRMGKVEENEKNSSSGQASSEHVNSLALEGNVAKGCLKISGKRLRDDTDVEVSSIVKKPAIESTMGARKLSSSNKTPAYSRDNSLKLLDKGKLQPSKSALASDDVISNDTPELARSASDLQVPNFRGTFSKSNSFTSLNSKPRVKLVDQVLHQEKSAKELSSPHLKDTAIRSIGKSMSFKSSIRSDSKVKMLSTRLSNVQDFKSTKRQNSFERQSSFKAESMAAPVSPAFRSFNKVASSGDHCSLSISSNHQDSKPVQLDDKSVALSRSSSFATRRSGDFSSSSGDFKRPSLHSYNISGNPSINGIHNIDKKSNLTIQKEDILPCSGINANDGVSDQPREMNNSGGSSKEYPKQLYKALSAKLLREEGNNLKATIDSAVLRKRGGYRKHRHDDSFTSIMSCDIDIKDHSSGRKIESSAAEVAKRHTISRNLTVDSFKHESFNAVKQFPFVSVEPLSSGGDEVQIAPLDVNYLSKDELNKVEAAMVFSLKSLAIPEHECIWQGCFEIFRNSKVLVLWDGIQAHLSSYSSPKVIEAVNKFQNRIVLNEVPRLSTWPIQFQEHGIGEDNIALFFFAKDVESYDKIYKVLLENMMKKDLALIGNLNGFELLIYPSNQLPENSQRWNMLSFLWGVFRGKKESCFPIVQDDLKRPSATQNLPPAITSLPENRRSPGPTPEDSACDNVSSELKVNGSKEFSNSLSTLAVNGDCDSKVSSLDVLLSRQNSSSSITVRSSRGNQCQELRDTCQEEGINSSCVTFQSTSVAKVSRRNQMLLESDSPVNRQQSLHYSQKLLDGGPEVSLKEARGEKTTLLDKVICSQDHEKFRIGVNLSTSGEVHVKENQDCRGLNMEVNRSPVVNYEYLHTSTCSVPLDLHARSSQEFAKDDDSHTEPGGTLEKMNNEDCGSVKAHNRSHEVCDDAIIPKISENAERHFFPLELNPTSDDQLGDRSLSWKIHSLEENWINDRVPNLELALGAKMEKAERKISEEHVHDGRTIKADDGVSAALSLSLSYPFPKEEKLPEPTQITERIMPRRDHTGPSMLIFGDLGDK